MRESHGFSRLPENDNAKGRTMQYCLLILMHLFIGAKKSILTQTVFLFPLTQPICQEGRLNQSGVFQLILVIVDTRKRYCNKTKQLLPVATHALCLEVLSSPYTDWDSYFIQYPQPTQSICMCNQMVSSDIREFILRALRHQKVFNNFQNVSAEHLIESFMMCSFVCLGFLQSISMP